MRLRYPLPGTRIENIGYTDSTQQSTSTEATFPVQCDLRIYQLNKNTQEVSTSETVTCNSSNYIICEIKVTPQQVFTTITKAVLLMKKVSGDVESFVVHQADADNNIDSKILSYVDECSISGITYKTIDLSECIKNNHAKTIYLAIASINNSTFSATTNSENNSIAIEYAEENDLILNGTSIKQTVGTGGQYEIDTRNGKLFYTQTLIKTPGNLMPFQLSINYTIDSARKINNSKHWFFNYEQTLTLSDGSYFYMDGTGRKHKFIKSTNNPLYFLDSTAKNGSTLLATRRLYTITDGTTTLTFNSSKKLISIKDTKGTSTITTTISYDSNGEISSVTDGMGKTYTFDRSTENTIKIKHEDIILTTIETTSFNRILSITDERSNSQTAFTYHTLQRRQTRLLKNIFNTATKEKCQFEFTSGQITSAKNYITKNEIDSPTTSYFFSYDFLHTYVDFCRNSDIIDNAYMKKDYQFASDGELLNVAEKLSDNNLSGITFVSKSNFTKTIGVISSTSQATFSFENNDAILASTQSINENLTITSDTIQLNTTDSDTTNYTLHIITSANFGSCIIDDPSRKIELLLKDGDDIIGRLYVDDSQRNMQIQTCDITLAKRAHSLTVQLLIQKCAIELSIHCIKLTKASTLPQMDCTNIQCSHFNSFTEHGETTTDWFLMPEKITINCADNVLTDVRYTFKDYMLTFLSIQKNGEKFSLWYNDGTNVFYNISEATVSFENGNPTDIKSVRLARITRDSLTTFMYPTSSASAFYQMHTVIDNGESSLESYIEYNSYLTIEESSDTNNTKTKYNYDNYGNTTSKTISTGIRTNQITYKYTYSDNGELLTEDSEGYLQNNFVTKYSYDSDNYLINTVLPTGDSIYYTLTSDKQKIALISSTDKTTGTATLKNAFTYDGDLISSITSNDTTINFSYDCRDNISLVQIADKYSLSKNSEYLTDGTRVTRTTFPNGTSAKNYYDKYDRLVKVSQIEGTTENILLVYIYSDYEIADTIVNPFDESLVNTANSLLRAVINNGTRTNYTYDVYGNVQTVQNPLFTYAVIERDANLRVTKSKIIPGRLHNIETTYHYKNFAEENIVAETTVDTNSNISFQTNYTVDGLQRQTATKVLLNGNGYETQYSYYPTKKFIKPLLRTTGTTYYVSYLKYKKITNDEETDDGQEKIEYNGNGDIISYGNVGYTYDSFGRLIREDNLLLNKTITYSYDVGNNIVSRKEYTYTTGDLSDNTITSSNYTYDESWKDCLLSINGTLLEYDTNGNPTNYNGIKLNWERSHLLSGWNTDSNNDISFTYDGDGIRLTKTTRVYARHIIETTYYYADSQLIGELVTERDGTKIISSKSKHFYYNSAGLIGFSVGSDTYLYRKNYFGDITAIYKDDALVAKYAYDAYGNCTVLNPDGTTNTTKTFIGNINPFRYRSYYFDIETGLYYLINRYYDPTTGRFINADKLENLEPEVLGGLNLFSYCRCNPIMYTDPEGTFVLTLTASYWLLWFLIGATVITGTAIIENNTHIIKDTLDNLFEFSSTNAPNATTSTANYTPDFKGIQTTISADISNYLSQLYYAKKTYQRKNAAKRIRFRKKTDARDAAKRAGGGKSPIHHPPSSKDRRGHYHPNVPGFEQHDHYYYPIIILLLKLMDGDD